MIRFIFQGISKKTRLKCLCSPPEPRRLKFRRVKGPGGGNPLRIRSSENRIPGAFCGGFSSHGEAGSGSPLETVRICAGVIISILANSLMHPPRKGYLTANVSINGRRPTASPKVSSPGTSIVTVSRLFSFISVISEITSTFDTCQVSTLPTNGFPASCLLNTVVYPRQKIETVSNGFYFGRLLHRAEVAVLRRIANRYGKGFAATAFRRLRRQIAKARTIPVTSPTAPEPS
jgi:hypothetical protein